MRKNWPLIALFAVFVMPALAAAYVLLFTDCKDLTTVQHGDLIRPAQPAIAGTYAPNKWNILYSDANDANILNNLQIALGKERDRVTIVQSAEQAGVMLIDPNGMYIMHYPQPVDMRGLLKDLRRLLKYSHAN